MYVGQLDENSSCKFKTTIFSWLSLLIIEYIHIEAASLSDHCHIVTTKWSSITMLMYSCYSLITVRSLWDHCEIIVRSLTHHCQITVKSLTHHCQIIDRSLSDRGVPAKPPHSPRAGMRAARSDSSFKQDECLRKVYRVPHNSSHSTCRLSQKYQRGRVFCIWLSVRYIRLIDCCMCIGDVLIYKVLSETREVGFFAGWEYRCVVFWLFCELSSRWMRRVLAL